MHGVLFCVIVDCCCLLRIHVFAFLQICDFAYTSTVGGTTTMTDNDATTDATTDNTTDTTNDNNNNNNTTTDTTTLMMVQYRRFMGYFDTLIYFFSPIATYMRRYQYFSPSHDYT